MLHIARHRSAMGLKEIRQQRGLSQRDLADMIHMDHATVQRAEKRARSAKLETYQKLAKVLDVDLIDLFADERTATELALLRAFRLLPDDGKDRWVEILRLAQSPTTPASEETDPTAPGTNVVSPR